jgi:biotin transport system substrate-specific component
MSHAALSYTVLDAMTGRLARTGRVGVRVASALFITALTAAAAQISAPIPFTDVPFTLQPMIVLLGGLALGSRLGCASQVAYLAAGIAGLPVFAASAALPPGPLRLLGPTGGYLLAYPAAAFLSGYLAERGLGRRWATSVIAMIAGLCVIYGSGVVWLAFFARGAAGSTAIGLTAALSGGLAPFVLADLVKIFVGAGAVPAFWRFVGHDPTRS